MASMSCSSILSPIKVTKIDLNYSREVVRTPKNIASKGQNEALIKNYSEHIIPNPTDMQPIVREQCLGTCYIYANQIMLEKVLKTDGSIPTDSLLLTSPFIGAIARDRLSELTDTPSTRELLHGGNAEPLHTLNGKRVYFIEQSEIKKLGSSKDVLSLEENFLKVFVKQQSLRFNGKTFTEHLQGSTPISLVMIMAFQKHIKVIKKISVSVSSKLIDSLNYTQAYVPVGHPNSYLVGHISTRYETTLEETKKEFSLAFSSQTPVPENAFKRFDKNFANFSIPFTTHRLQKGIFVKAGINSEIFGEGHAVTLTNIVVDQKTGVLIGFIYLNSHSSEFGVEGYGFLHALEVEKYVISVEAIDEIIR